jgi:hypothetical protein
MSAPLIKDSAQFARSMAPNAFGMNPAVAERLVSFGVDPQDLAASIVEPKVHRNAVAAGFRRFPVDRGGATVREFSIDHTDVTQRELLQRAALEAYETGFIAEEVAPTEFVDQQKGMVVLEDSTEERREVNDLASGGGDVNLLQSAVSTVNFTLVSRALQDFQTRHDAAIAPMFAGMARLVEKTSRKAKRQHEIRVKTALMTATNYASANRLANSTNENWNGGSSATPIADMLGVLAAMYAPATHAVMSLEMWQAAQQNDELRGIVASRLSNEGLLTARDFGLFFGIPNVVIDEQRYTAAGAATQSRLYDSDKIALLHVNASPSSRTFLRNYQLRQGSNGFVVLSWYDPARGNKGADFAKVAFDQDLVIPDNTYGGILTGCRV